MPIFFGSLPHEPASLSRTECVNPLGTSTSERLMYSRDRLLLALRVLSAVTYDDRCDDRDLTELRHLAECEQERQLPLDDLACAVIWREIRVWRALNTQPAGVFN